MVKNPYPARWIVDNEPKRPAGWLVLNDRELKVELVWESVRSYYVDPNPMTRDVMVTHANDLEESDLRSRGVGRISEYEIELISRIYHAGCCLGSSAVKMFAYHVAMEWVRLKSDEDIGTLLDSHRDVIPRQLRLFCNVYSAYRQDEQHRSFWYWLINKVEKFLAIVGSSAQLDFLEHAYVSLLMDVSCALGGERDSLYRVTADEVIALVKMEADILHRGDKSIMTRPLKGTLMIQLSYLLLKMRKSGTPSVVYKHMSNEDLRKALDNGELWIRDTRDLNDKWEGVPAQEIVEEMSKDGVSWLKNVNWSYGKTFYVACYSREREGVDLDARYGECTLAYNADRLVDFLGPIYLHVEHLKHQDGSEYKEGYPMLSQVAVLDVMYDREEARKELELLVRCIDTLGRYDSEKQEFFGEILQYWKLSIKDPVDRADPDKKWYREAERRYVIFYYDDYNYIHQRLDNRWLKLASTVVMAPDGVFGDLDSRSFMELKDNLGVRYESTTLNDYYTCDECLARTYPSGSGSLPKCRMCGSQRLSYHRFLSE